MDIEKLKQLKNKKEAWIVGIIGFVILAATNPTPRNYANFAVGFPSQRGLTIFASADVRLDGAQRLYCQKVGTPQGVETRESCWSFLEWETNQNPDFLKEYFQAKVVGRRNFLLFSIYYLDGISESEMYMLPTNAAGYAASANVAPWNYTSIGILTLFITIDMFIVLVSMFILAIALVLAKDKFPNLLEERHDRYKGR